MPTNYYVFAEDGRSIEETLIKEGLGMARRRDGQHRERLMALEGGAQSDGDECLWE